MRLYFKLIAITNSNGISTMALANKKATTDFVNNHETSRCT